MIQSDSCDFEVNLYWLKPAHLTNLRPLAVYLANLDKDVIIQALCKGSTSNGLNLASLRATFMLRYLSRNYKVPIRRLMPYGYELPYNDSNINLKEKRKLGNRFDFKIVYE